MKYALILLGLAAFASSAPQPRKLFHEHFDDFMDLIREEVGDELNQLMEEYVQFEEFRSSLDYVTTANFKDLVYEMESLPEFRAVVDFLEKDNIDILFFIDRFNELVNDGFQRPERTARLEPSGTDVSSYIKDSIDLFPKAKLADLFEQKKAEDEAFKAAVENLESDEWEQIWGALWENETFLVEAQILADNGIQLGALLSEIAAIFGQN